MRYAKRRDANEGDIVDALIAAGCDVLQADDIDLIVGRAGMNFLLEVKIPGQEKPKKLRPIQKTLRAMWRGQYTIVTTPEQALIAVGLS